MMKEKYYVSLTFNFYKDKKADQWIGECNELGTSAFGDNIEEVTEALEELVELHLTTLEETGERERFFKSNDIKIFRESLPSEFNIKMPTSKNVYVKTFTQRIATI